MDLKFKYFTLPFLQHYSAWLLTTIIVVGVGRCTRTLGVTNVLSSSLVHLDNSKAAAHVAVRPSLLDTVKQNNHNFWGKYVVSSLYFISNGLTELSVNQMTSGSRLLRSIVMEFFLLSTNFSNTTLSKCNIFVLEQVVGPGVLQTFSTCTVKQQINQSLKSIPPT